nr:MAG TPA: structural protein [Bacteriophage sp.]
MAQTETTVITGNANYDDVLVAILLGPVWDERPSFHFGKYNISDIAVRDIIAHPKYNELRNRYNEIEKAWCKIINGDTTITKQKWDGLVNSFKELAGKMERRGVPGEANDLWGIFNYNHLQDKSPAPEGESWVDPIVKYRGSSNRRAIHLTDGMELYPSDKIAYNSIQFDALRVPEIIAWRNNIISKRDDTFKISDEYAADPVNAFVKSFRLLNDAVAATKLLCNGSIVTDRAWNRIAEYVNGKLTETMLLHPYPVKKDNPKETLKKYALFSSDMRESYHNLIIARDNGTPLTTLRKLRQAITDHDKSTYDNEKAQLIDYINLNNGGRSDPLFREDPADITPYTDSRPYPITMPREHRGLPDYDKYFGTNHWDNDLKVIFYYLNGGQNLTSEIVGSTEYARLNAIGLQDSNALASAKPIFADAIELWRDYHQAIANNQADIAKAKYKLLIAKVDELIIATGNPTMPAENGKVLSFSVFLKPYYTPEESLNKANAEPWSSARWSKYFTSQFDDKAGINRRTMFAGSADGLNYKLDPKDIAGKARALEYSLDYANLGIWFLSYIAADNRIRPLKLTSNYDFTGIKGWVPVTKDKFDEIKAAFIDYIEAVFRDHFGLRDLVSFPRPTAEQTNKLAQLADVRGGSPETVRDFRNGNFHLTSELVPANFTPYGRRSELNTAAGDLRKAISDYISTTTPTTAQYNAIVTEYNRLKTELATYNDYYNTNRQFEGKYAITMDRANIRLPEKRGASDNEYNDLLRRIRDYENQARAGYTTTNPQNEYRALINKRTALVDEINTYNRKYNYSATDGDKYINPDIYTPEQPRNYTADEQLKINGLNDRFLEVRRKLDAYKRALIPSYFLWNDLNTNDTWHANTYRNEFLPHQNYQGFQYILDHYNEWNTRLDNISSNTDIPNIPKLIAVDKAELDTQISEYRRDLAKHKAATNNNLYQALVDKYGTLGAAITNFNRKYQLDDPRFAVYSDLKLRPLEEPRENEGFSPLPQPINVGKLVQYPFDPTGISKQNHVEEIYDLTDTNRNEFNYIIPRYAPFYSNSVKIERLDTEDNQPLVLEKDHDYYLGGHFGEMEPYVGGKQRIESLILFDDRRITGRYKVTYQTLGGSFILDATGYATQIANYLVNPLQTPWAEIVGRPVNYPVKPHGHDVGELVGVQDLIDAILQLSAANREIARAEAAQASAVADLLDETAAMRQLSRDTKANVQNLMNQVQEKYLEIKALIRNGNVVGGGGGGSSSADIDAAVYRMKNELTLLFTTMLNDKADDLSGKVKARLDALSNRLDNINTVMNTAIEAKLKEKDYVPYSATVRNQINANGVLRLTADKQVGLPATGVNYLDPTNNAIITTRKTEIKRDTVVIRETATGNKPVVSRVNDIHIGADGRTIGLSATINNVLGTISPPSITTATAVPAMTTSAMDIVKKVKVHTKGEENAPTNTLGGSKKVIYSLSSTDANLIGKHFFNAEGWTNVNDDLSQTTSYILNPASSFAFTLKALQELDGKIQAAAKGDFIPTSKLQSGNGVEAGKIVVADANKRIASVGAINFSNADYNSDTLGVREGLYTDRYAAIAYNVMTSHTDIKYNLVTEFEKLRDNHRYNTRINKSGMSVTAPTDALKRMAQLPVYTGSTNEGYLVDPAKAKALINFNSDQLSAEAVLGATALAFKDTSNKLGDLERRVSAATGGRADYIPLDKIQAVVSDQYEVLVADGRKGTLPSYLQFRDSKAAFELRSDGIAVHYANLVVDDVKVKASDTNAYKTKTFTETLRQADTVRLENSERFAGNQLSNANIDKLKGYFDTATVVNLDDKRMFVATTTNYGFTDNSTTTSFYNPGAIDAILLGTLKHVDKRLVTLSTQYDGFSKSTSSALSAVTTKASSLEQTTTQLSSRVTELEKGPTTRALNEVRAVGNNAQATANQAKSIADNNNSRLNAMDALVSTATSDVARLKSDVNSLNGRIPNISIQGNATDYGTGKLPKFIESGKLSVSSVQFAVGSTTKVMNLSGTDLMYNGRFRPQEINLTSDIRKKENLSVITDALKRVLTLNGYFYNFKGSDEESVGLIAQQVQKVLPSAVSEDADGTLSLNYNGIVALLVEATREQEVRYYELLRRVEALEAKRK